LISSLASHQIEAFRNATLEYLIVNLEPDRELQTSDLFADHSSRQVEQKLKKTACKFRLFEGDTAVTLPKAVKILPKMDLIFIDGGKSFAEVESD